MDAWMEVGKDLLAVAGVILIIYQVGIAMFKITTPAVSLKKEIEKHGDRLDDMDVYFKNDLERFKAINATLNGLLQANVSMMNHMIDGNNTERMKKTRDDLVSLMKDI